jgi:hypothetical protein
VAVAAALGAFTVACAGASISTPQSLQPLPEPIESVALAPSGGVLADAIGTELFGRGFRVIDTRGTSNYLVRLNLDEIELMQPKSLSAIRERGINAVLSCSSVAGDDNKPQSATVRVVSTSTGELIAAVSWQNGRGGQEGSIADRTMRKDIVAAAQQIAEELARQLHRH